MTPSRLLVAVVGVLSLTFVIGMTVFGGVGQDSSSALAISTALLASESCAVSGPVTGLAPDQSANADTIVATSMSASGEDQQVAQIAVMVALTESSLHNIDHGDKDSVGLFQQRPSQGWGTVAQIMDPQYATTTFVKHLLAVPNWKSLAPWVAAQDVQKSAFSDGSNYQANWPVAGAIVNVVMGNGNAPGSCGQGISGGVVGPPSAHGLPANYVIPPGTPPNHAAVVAFAIAQLGKPYVWGGAGPSSYDCSGLTMAAWATVGVSLVHGSATQQQEGQEVIEAQLVAGDLVLTPGSDAPGPGIAGHVGIYLGDGLVLSAIDVQDGIAVQSWTTFVSGGLDALRDPAPGE